MDKTQDYSILKKLGLSKTEVLCYETLLKQGPANTAELADRLCRQRTDLYRTLKHLEEIGFVDRVKTEAQPAYYWANPLDLAMNNFVSYQLKLVNPLTGPLVFRPGARVWDPPR